MPDFNIHLTPDQILNLHTTPVQILNPAQVKQLTATTSEDVMLRKFEAAYSYGPIPINERNPTLNGIFFYRQQIVDHYLQEGISSEAKKYLETIFEKCNDTIKEIMGL
jgi:hypothetical protein